MYFFILTCPLFSLRVSTTLSCELFFTLSFVIKEGIITKGKLSDDIFFFISSRLFQIVIILKMDCYNSPSNPTFWELLLNTKIVMTNWQLVTNHGGISLPQVWTAQIKPTWKYNLPSHSITGRALTKWFYIFKQKMHPF